VASAVSTFGVVKKTGLAARRVVRPSKPPDPAAAVSLAGRTLQGGPVASGCGDLADRRG
jgi:hypothetical protein